MFIIGATNLSSKISIAPRSSSTSPILQWLSLSMYWGLSFTQSHDDDIASSISIIDRGEVSWFGTLPYHRSSMSMYY